MELLETLEAAARGSFPSDDGTVEVLPAPPGPCDGVFAFTAHGIVAAGVPEPWVRDRLPSDDLTGPIRADFLAALGRELGAAPGSVDVLLAAAATDGTGGIDLIETSEGDARTERARLYRTDVRSWTDAGGGAIVNVGHGVAGRWDLSFELDPSRRALGQGRGLIAAARGLIPSEEILFASVAPGNARCLRACLAAGFTPIGSEALFLTRPAESAAG